MKSAAIIIASCAASILPACVCGSTEPTASPPGHASRALAPLRTPSAQTVVLPHDWQPGKLDRDAGSPR